MTKPDPAPLDAAIESLLCAERPIDAPPGDVAERVLARLHQQIVALPPGGGSGGGGSGGAAPSAQHPRSWSGLGRPLASLSVALLVGGAIGGVIHAAFTSPAVVYVDRAVPAQVVAPASASVTPLAPPHETPVVAVAPTAPAAPGQVRPPKPSTGEQLAAERALLDVARAAVGEGNGAGALDAVARHEKEFPAGLLVEEREALAVRALILAGRGADARARGATFEQRYPSSLALAGIRAALEAIP